NHALLPSLILDPILLIFVHLSEHETSNKKTKSRKELDFLSFSFERVSPSFIGLLLLLTPFAAFAAFRLCGISATATPDYCAFCLHITHVLFVRCSPEVLK